MTPYFIRNTHDQTFERQQKIEQQKQMFWAFQYISKYMRLEHEIIEGEWKPYSEYLEVQKLDAAPEFGQDPILVDFMQSLEQKLPEIGAWNGDSNAKVEDDKDFKMWTKSRILSGEDIKGGSQTREVVNRNQLQQEHKKLYALEKDLETFLNKPSAPQKGIPEWFWVIEMHKPSKTPTTKFVKLVDISREPGESKLCKHTTTLIFGRGDSSLYHLRNKDGSSAYYGYYNNQTTDWSFENDRST